MERPLELLQNVARNSDNKTLAKYLEFCSELKLFSLTKEGRENIVTFTNSLLTSKELCNSGLAILDVLIEQCPKDILSINISNWISQTIKVLVNPDDGSFCPLSWKVLGKLIQLSVDFPEARKNIALTVITKVLDHFVREAKNSKEDTLTFLQCLEQTLGSYGKSCGFHKEAVGTLIFSYLEASPCCVFVAGQCFLNLAASGSPGANGENYALSWLKHQKFLLNSLHSQLDDLFENINEAQDAHKVYQLDENYPIIPKVTEKNLLRKKQHQVKQFQSLSVFLNILLLGKFPSRKKILPESILGLIWRGLSINNQTLTTLQHSADISHLATVISQINLASLETLDALMTSCRMNLLPFSSLICRIFSQTLKWTETSVWPFGLTKPLSSLRVKIYECLCKWLSISRACSGVEKYMDEIIYSALTDIDYKPPALALKVPGGRGKKSKVKVTEEINPSMDFIINPEMSAGICEAALKCISVLVNSSSSHLKAVHYRDLQKAVVGKIISIQQCETPPPYSNDKCRFALYESLLSLCQNSHHSFPPPINYAPQLFSMGTKDSSIEVSRYCLFALQCINKVLRPVCPAMDFPISEQRLPILDVTANDNEEISYLLNDDSNRKRRQKRKRNEHVTSTPVRKNATEHRSYDESVLCDHEMSEVNGEVDAGKPCSPENINPNVENDRLSNDDSNDVYSNVNDLTEIPNSKEKRICVNEIITDISNLPESDKPLPSNNCNPGPLKISVNSQNQDVNESIPGPSNSLPVLANSSINTADDQTGPPEKMLKSSTGNSADHEVTPITNNYITNYRNSSGLVVTLISSPKSPIIEIIDDNSRDSSEEEMLKSFVDEVQ